MWRRVASQSPVVAGDSNDAYIKAFTALGQMLRDGRSLSGHERNCCFLNTRDQRFATVSAASGLDFADDGRAIGLTDWDHDGDVDAWLANRTGPRLRFMRNDSPSNAEFVSVRLTGTRCNRDAIGARLELHLAPRSSSNQKPLQLIRTVHAGSGFMSQASKRVHFGVAGYSPRKLVVRWPDGTAEEFRNLQTGRHYDIRQGEADTAEWTRPSPATALTPSTLIAATTSSQARIVISGRLPMPAVQFKSIRPDANSVEPGPTLINLWSTSCLPCLKELAEFSRRQSDLRQAGLRVLALNVDELIENPASDLSCSRGILEEMQFPFAAAAIDADQSGMLDIFHQAFLSLRRPLPVPSSFLSAADGRVVVIYRGPVSIDQLIRDVELLNADAELIRQQAVPFAGRWLGPPIGPSAKRHATAFMRGGFVDQGATYLENYLYRHLQNKGWGPRHSWPSRRSLADLCGLLADFYRLQNKPQKVASVYQVALKFDPNYAPSFVNLGKIMIGQRKFSEGLKLLQQAHDLSPSDPVIASDLGIAYAMSGQAAQAEQAFLNLLERDVDSYGARLNLGRLYFQSGRYNDAAVQFRQHLDQDAHSREALRSLCWILACSPHDGDRDPRQAVELARRLSGQSPRQSAELMDLGAAIRAELGDFAGAVSAAREAVRLAQQEGNRAQLAEAQHRLRLYLKRSPYRLPIGDREPE